MAVEGHGGPQWRPRGERGPMAEAAKEETEHPGLISEARATSVNPGCPAQSGMISRYENGCPKFATHRDVGGGSEGFQGFLFRGGGFF